MFGGTPANVRVFTNQLFVTNAPPSDPSRISAALSHTGSSWLSAFHIPAMAIAREVLSLSCYSYKETDDGIEEAWRKLLLASGLM